MLTLNNNYSHRFSKAKDVYCITNNNVLSIQQRTFYSVPYKPTEIDKRTQSTLSGINNVIVAYVEEELCNKHISILKNNQKKYICERILDRSNQSSIDENNKIKTGDRSVNDIDQYFNGSKTLDMVELGGSDNDIIPFKLSMRELKQISKFIGMPVAILLDETLVDDKIVYNVYIDYMRGGEEKDYSI